MSKKADQASRKKPKKSDSKAKLKDKDMVPAPYTDVTRPVQEMSLTDRAVKKEKKKNREKWTLASLSTPGVNDESTEVDPELQETRKDKGTKDTNGDGHTEASVHAVERGKKDKKRKRGTEQPEGIQEASGTNSDSTKKKRRKLGPTGDQSPAKGERAHKGKSKQKTESPESNEPHYSEFLDDSAAAAPPSEAEARSFLTKHNITITTPSDMQPVLPAITFDQLSIPNGLRVAFVDFKEPSPIQACTWPPALKGRDVIGIAETGSGKTLAFGIPALSHLIRSAKKTPQKPTVSVLVVAPTRELAIQTHETLSAMGKPFGIASVAVFGGVPKESQIRMLRNASESGSGAITRIVVGTPGRILDLVREGVCDLSRVDYLVLDEADRMLDKGFENDIRNIIASTKPIEERQTMMFSATWPEAVRRLASTFQRSPVRITVGSDDLTANSRVEQVIEVFDDARSKDERLLATLRSFSHKKVTKGGSTDSRVLVFALYKKEASRVEQMLKGRGFSVCALHGDMPQGARMEMLESFKNGRTNLMVATDVAARGLDIPDVSAVVNYTFPLTIEDYIHRIGRTGRGGKSGKSITFFTGDGHERSLAGELAKVLREGGFDYEALKKFPMTIKKREHSVYGAFYRDDIPVPTGPTKIVF